MKTIFLINGFRHQATEESFDYIAKIFSTKGYKVLKPRIDWNYKVMSDYINQFENFYNKNKSEYNHVLGFSFGAMIAFISAAHLMPDELSLCSLSSFFKEDTEKSRWVRGIGVKRLKDFDLYSSQDIAKRITAKTSVFYGEKEAKRYPDLKARCEQVSKQIPGTELIIAQASEHNVSDKGYENAIKSKYA